MGLFHRKQKSSAPKSMEEYLAKLDGMAKSSLMPEYDYVPETLLKEFLDLNNLSLARDENSYSLEGVTAEDLASDNSFTSVTGLFDTIKPIVDEKVLKGINIYEGDGITLEFCLKERKALYGRIDSVGRNYVFTNALPFYEMADLIVNKAPDMNLDEFYQMYYEDIDLTGELKKLGKNETFEMYGFNGNPDEMVEFLALEGEDLDGNTSLEYSLSLNHSYHRYPENKWKYCEVGSINGVALENVATELETLKDDSTMVNNPYYKGEISGRYPIGELKEWIQKCDYEKAMKTAAQKFMGRN